jgi:tetratricopeptide (TPR) repeat protein
MGNPQKALEYLDRSKKIQPKAPSVRSLEVVLLSRTGQEPKALAMARDALAANVYDYDLVNAAFILGWRAGDFPTAIKAMDLRLKDWPQTRVNGYVQLGNMYTTGLPDPAKALDAFKKAMELTPEAQRKALLPQIPPVYWPKIGFANAVPVQAAPAQTSSASK